MAAKVKEDMQEEKGLNIELFGKTVWQDSLERSSIEEGGEVGG